MDLNTLDRLAITVPYHSADRSHSYLYYEKGGIASYYRLIEPPSPFSRPFIPIVFFIPSCCFLCSLKYQVVSQNHLTFVIWQLFQTVVHTQYPIPNYDTQLAHFLLLCLGVEVVVFRRHSFNLDHYSFAVPEKSSITK